MRRIAMCVFALLLGVPGAMAQLPTGTILGAVKDPSGQSVPQASLTARDVETGQVRTANSAADGTYRFDALPVGHYEVRGEHAGFSAEVVSGIELTVGQEAVVNITFSIGAVSQTVSVTAEATLVNTTTASLGSLVDEQKIADLPLNGRNYVDLMLLQPGIEQQTNKSPGGLQIGTWFSSNGAPVRSNNFLLDGALLTNLLGANPGSNSGSTLGIDGIREWRTITNSFSAEYGMTMGSQMMIVSKGGSNAFHGSAFEYLRNDVLDAANFFYVPVQANNYARIPPYQRNDFGGSFGGPIKKDKTFVFAVYEGLRERLGVTTIDNVMPSADLVTTNNPGCGGCSVPAVIQPLLALFPAPNVPGKNQYTYPFSQPTDEDYGQMRVDQNISASDTFFVRYTGDNVTQTQTASYPEFGVLITSKNQYVTLSENHIFSSSLLNTARFSFSRTNLAEVLPPNLDGPPVSFITGNLLGALSIGGVTSSGNTAGAPQGEKQNVFTYSDDVFKTSGRHALKFGVLINHFQQYILKETGIRGNVSFSSINNFLEGEPSSYSSTTLPGSVTNKTYHFDTLGFYAQDDVRVRSNFTLNLGLRYEISTTLNETQNHAASFRNILTDAAPTVGPPFNDPSLHNFSPRLGFAWNVFGDGKTAVRGGFALVYDIANMGTAEFIGSATPPFVTGSTVTVAPGTLLQLPLVFPSTPTSNSLFGINWNLKQPYMLQYNLAVERQLPENLVLTVAYGGSRGIHLIQTTEGNPVIPQIVNGQPFWAGGNGTGCVLGQITVGCRLNPDWGTYEMETSGGDSYYNSLQVQLVKHLSKGLEVQGSFTLSKLIDDGQGQAGGENDSTPILPEYPEDLRLERGPASFDLPKNLRVNAIYTFPNFHHEIGVLGKVLSGWATTGILSAQSGYPFTPVLNAQRSRSGVLGGSALSPAGSSTDRPDWAPGRDVANAEHGTSTGCGTGSSAIPAGTPLGTTSLWFDPCAFTLQPVGTLGDIGRDILRGPGFVNLDFSIIKDTPLKFREGAMLEFRAEMFNVLNHPNFGTPETGGSNNGAANVFAGTVTDVTENPLAGAGVLTLTANPSREIQFGLKFLF